MGRFRPLSVWPEGKTSIKSMGTPGTPREHQGNTDNYHINHEVIEGNTGNTEKTPCLAVHVPDVPDQPGDVVASGVCFRSKIPQDLTHDQAGMVQCSSCANRQDLGKSSPGRKAVIRCRHPTMHGGLWPVLAGDLWRRCASYQQ